jgi:hypothetical protein
MAMTMAMLTSLRLVFGVLLSKMDRCSGVSALE